MTDVPPWSIKNFFPITLPARRLGGSDNWASPYGFRPLFAAMRPKDRSWYCYDVIIHSADEIEFVAYDMKDNLSGGKGSEIYRFRHSVTKTDGAREAIENAIVERAAEFAILRRHHEIATAEEALLEQYTTEILNNLNRDHS